jgi:hypothetical protein
MVLIPEEGAVEELAPASPDPAFGDGVGRRRRLHPIQMIGTSVSG